MRVGNGTIDIGNNYANRDSDNGAADSTGINVSNFQLVGVGGDTTSHFGYVNIANLSAKEKLFITHGMKENAPGAGTAPDRKESVAKWVNTTNPIDIIRVTTLTAATFDANSQVVVLGWDPADTHTDNFFGEEGSASGSTLDITLATARKYIWSQFLVRAGGAGTTLALRVGNGSLDSAANYAMRQSNDGLADVITTTLNEIKLNQITLDANELLYVNIFMINRSANEKLLIVHTVDLNAGLGAGFAPSRDEIVAKHVNTANQDDHIGIVATAGSISATSSQGKAWGGD